MAQATPDESPMPADPMPEAAPAVEPGDPLTQEAGPVMSTVVTSIPECADYVGKVRTCIAHLAATGVIAPEMRTEAYQTLQQIIATWQGITDRATLARTCSQAYQRSKETYNPHGCDF